MNIKKRLLMIAGIVAVVCVIICGVFYESTIKSQEQQLQMNDINKFVSKDELMRKINGDEELKDNLKQLIQDEDGNVSNTNIKRIIPIVVQGIKGDKLTEEAKSQLVDLGMTTEQIENIESVAAKFIIEDISDKFEKDNPIDKMNRILLIVLSGLIIVSGMIFVFCYKGKKYI